MKELSRVPILTETDILVVEGTLAGCVVAHRSAERGLQTTLSTTACSLPKEIVVCRRPWVTEEELCLLPAPFAEAFRASISHTLPAGEHLLNLSQLAIRVEDILLDAGVRLFYGMSPCGILQGTDNYLGGVVFGGKFGLRGIAAKRVVDATPDAVVAALAGASIVSRRPAAEGVRVMVCAKVTPLDASVGVADAKSATPETQGLVTEWPKETVLDVSGSRELIDQQIPLHGPYAEIWLRLPAGDEPLLRYSGLVDCSRRVLLELGMQLTEQRRERGAQPLFIHRLSGALHVEPLVRAGNDCPKNLLLCSSARDVDIGEARGWAEPYASASLADELATSALSETLPDCAETPRAVLGPPAPACRNRNSAAGDLRFSDTCPLHDTGNSVAMSVDKLPVLATCDVLVAGAGTSGVPAALQAARLGARTIILEQQEDVGGTHTVGGVGAFWFGRLTPFHERYNGACNDLVERSGMAVEVAMRNCLHDAGVRVLTGCPIIGVWMDDTRVAGVVVATERGASIVLGKVTVDATGDADLAAWAGAPCDYGNDRDAWTYWASFANFNEERRTASRQYESAIEVRDPWDLTRTIVTGRRRQGMWRRFAHEMPQHYAAPRESRRLDGEARISYGGILAGETFEDLVTVCESNFDIKGIASSELICSGVIWSWRTRTNYQAALPYRALLPKGIEGLLVAGKAFSASHDALALARMQRDMACLGASAAVAAVEAARTGTSLRELDVSALQEQWVEIGSLLPADLQRWAKPAASYDQHDAKRDVASLAKGNSRSARKLARLAQSTDSIAPLREAFDHTSGPAVKTKIARLLCFLGDTSKVDFLLNRTAEQIATGLPGPFRRTVAIAPEHGWAGEPVYSLFAIGLTNRGPETAPLLVRIAKRIPDDPAAFASKTASPFEYVRVICAVAERHPVPEMRPALELLLANPGLHHLTIPASADPRQAVDAVLERRAYLELALGRALARNGDERGYHILLDYLDDIRGTLARSAMDELHALLGPPAEASGAGWAEHISRHAGNRAPQPLER